MKRKGILLFLSVIFVSFTAKVYSQTSISGIINQYTAVDSIYPTKDTIEVRNPSLFAANDTVMVYQVKGAVVRTDTTSDGTRHLFGTFQSVNSANNAGNYEIILVEKVDGNKVIFKVSLNNTYTANDLVQLITVPSYVRASVNSELTCKAWEDSTGGVLVLMVSDTLFLNANINVSGKGLTGAKPFLSSGQCAITDTILYKSYYLGEDADTVSSGFKGESVAKYKFSFAKGVGRWANGGGAGSGRFAGGGGGGNAGNGGLGGAEDTTFCHETSWSYENWNGLGGNDGYGLDGIYGTINDSTIFLGGGGGSGTYTSGLSASNGGNGGGAVVIVATNVKTNGFQIIADGESVSDVTIDPLNVTNVVNASAGGGGGGGVVVFDVDSVISNDLKISAQGGQGGFVSTLGTSGPGGGGGGGVVFWQKFKPDNVTSTLGGGDKGFVLDGYPGSQSGYNATNGNFGATKNNVKTPLTGFLYNSIIANQDVCEGYPTRLLEGSTLRGGNGTYTYQWQDSPDGFAWSDISGATEPDYQASSLTDTTYYRRVAYSGPITDFGISIKVNFHPSIVNNAILGDDLIKCIDNLGDTITGSVVSQGGDSQNYSYVWQYRLDSDSWSDFSSAETNDTLMFPGIISDTTFVRRIVISGACRDTVPVPIEIIALPKIDSNIITAVDEICWNDDPDVIVGKSPSFGDGSYTYQWQNSGDGVVFTDIPGANQKDYDPSNLTDTTYYKRIVYSDDCFDESEPDTIIVLELIDNNNILTSAPTRTCYDTKKQIDASVPTGGRLVYDYQWQESPDGSSWTDVIEDATSQNYLSYNMINPAYFRRYVKSGACNNTSASIQVTIDPLPIGLLTSFVDTSCSEEEVVLDFTITAGSPTYSLIYTDSENNYTETGLVENLNQITVNPTTDQINHELNYSIVSVEDQNGCFATDTTGLGVQTIYGNPKADAGISNEHCLLSYQLDATPTLGSGMWKAISETGTTEFNADYSNPNANIIVSQAGAYTYEWKESNWRCVDSVNVDLRFYEQLTDVKIIDDQGKDDGEVRLFYIDEYTLNGEFTDPDMTDTVVSKWLKISDNDGDIIDDEAISTDIINLFDNKNTGIKITWTVQKGVCSEIIDTLNLKLEEIFTPTGFTPNGDGINDNLKFLGLENAQSSELIIYNRWGTEVFRVKNLSNDAGWDGKNNNGNDLPEDTYFYALKVISKSGSEDNYKGFIVLKRY